MVEKDPPKRILQSKPQEERADAQRDRHRPQPGKNKYRGNGSTRRPEERSWFQSIKRR